MNRIFMSGHILVRKNNHRDTSPGQTREEPLPRPVMGAPFYQSRLFDRRRQNRIRPGTFYRAWNAWKGAIRNNTW